MAEKRKDSKGRVLKTGENQRKNGTYEYRYTDNRGKQHSVYAKTLDELRRKEETIIRDMMDGIDFAAGEITVSELIDKYMNLKRDLSTNSRRAYGTPIKRIKASPFGQIKVKNVKPSDAKAFYISLHDDGIKRNTIMIYHSVLRPSFEMAVDDDMIRKNPFKFQVSDIIQADAEIREALTKEQQRIYLRYLREHERDHYCDDIELLIETGLRVSELYGLTRSDIDFKARRIRVERQLCRTADKPYFVTTPKTISGNRFLPMSDRAYILLKEIIRKRKTPKVEMMVDGISGFLFLDKSGRPKVAMHLENYMRCVQKRFSEYYGKPFPRVTPHVLRHTFCTNMQQSGIDIKSLQYLMGHSNVSVTLDVYSHVNVDAVHEAFAKAAGCR